MIYTARLFIHLYKFCFKTGYFLKSITIKATFLIGKRPTEGVGVAKAAFVGQDQVRFALSREASQLST